LNVAATFNSGRVTICPTYSYQSFIQSILCLIDRPSDLLGYENLRTLLELKQTISRLEKFLYEMVNIARPDGYAKVTAEFSPKFIQQTMFKPKNRL